MRNLLALVGLLVVIFAVAGWFLGWYQFETDGHHDVKIEINGPKIEKDVHQGAQKLEKAVENKVNNGSPNTPALPPGYTPGTPPPGGGLPPIYPQGEQYVLPPSTPVPVQQPQRPGGVH
jgi:hypothetical protein